jgi:hypothetical protein
VDFEFFKYELLKSKASVLRGKDNSNNVTPTLTQRSRIRMGDTEKSDLVKESLTSQEKIELNKQRGSLVSFMWGALLATYCKKLEKIPVRKTSKPRTNCLGQFSSNKS